MSLTSTFTQFGSEVKLLDTCTRLECFFFLMTLSISTPPHLWENILLYFFTPLHLFGWLAYEFITSRQFCFFCSRQEIHW